MQNKITVKPNRKVTVKPRRITVKQFDGEEKYIDPMLNELHDTLIAKHEDILKNISEQLKKEILEDVSI